MLNFEAQFHNNRYFWPMSDTTPHAKPERFTVDDLEPVDSRNIGGSRDPDGSDNVVHIKGTDYYVNFQMWRTEKLGWRIDLENARLVTKDWGDLPENQSVLPVAVRKLLNDVWGHKALPKNTQDKKLG